MSRKQNIEILGVSFEVLVTAFYCHKQKLKILFLIGSYGRENRQRKKTSKTVKQEVFEFYLKR